MRNHAGKKYGLTRIGGNDVREDGFECGRGSRYRTINFSVCFNNKALADKLAVFKNGVRRP